jgi:hypothetical protein
MTDRLTNNQLLEVGETLNPPNGKTKLIMQADGNLVLYREDTGDWLWDTATDSRPVFRTIMQDDGNLVCYSRDGHAYWGSGTSGHPGSTLVLQDDGNLVIYTPQGNALWASNTVQDWTTKKYDSGDVHLATGFWMHTTATMSATGAIAGTTRTWSTLGFRGFHASVAAVVLDEHDKVLWPPNPQITKRQYGVDGWAISPMFGWGGAGPHDRKDSWAVQVDPSILPQVRKLSCVHFLDPKNMLLADLGIVGDDIAKVLQVIAMFIGA